MLVIGCLGLYLLFLEPSPFPASFVGLVAVGTLAVIGSALLALALPLFAMRAQDKGDSKA